MTAKLTRRKPRTVRVELIRREAEALVDAAWWTSVQGGKYQLRERARRKLERALEDALEPTK